MKKWDNPIVQVAAAAALSRIAVLLLGVWTAIHAFQRPAWRRQDLNELSTVLLHWRCIVT